MAEFKLEGDYIQLIQLLKATGLAENGGEAQAIVAAGLVKYNGQPDHRKRLKVKAGDTVEFEGHILYIHA